MFNPEAFENYFENADLDHNGSISISEANSFFERFNLPEIDLVRIWEFINQDESGLIGRSDFFNALKLIKLSQEGVSLTPEIVHEVLSDPWSIEIPAPEMPLQLVPVTLNEDTEIDNDPISSTSPEAQIRGDEIANNISIDENTNNTSIQSIPSSDEADDDDDVALDIALNASIEAAMSEGVSGFRLVDLLRGLSISSPTTTEADSDNINQSVEASSGTGLSEISSDINLGTCNFCCENPINSACVPCGHMSGCMDCLKRIMESNSLCPNCRSVASVIKLFTS